ncbi:transcriptional repressor NrdR [Granulicatella balaenopterae]|uniref:Transcriptional repressor NrdR n=1 Tax=Granulicatella balaenopterae TaxID=137733 RepID=A0A1H9HRY2_9LACT|nr:transcriptional regulator NrdR [Granulicatella balaenopterae]SEQ65109.1 transcriptional repressor NrdR [Granulicatella balaenopterae]
MLCPRCKHNGSKVIDSRPADEGRAIRRRRECEECQYRFTTFERIEKTPLLIIKRNGNREEFNREKLLNGIVRSSEKRPISLEEMEKIVNIIEHDIHQYGENEVSSSLIGEMVMDHLAKIDDVAYIRFASVYRQFTDRAMFIKELEKMSTDKDGEKK